MTVSEVSWKAHMDGRKRFIIHWLRVPLARKIFFLALPVGGEVGNGNISYVFSNMYCTNVIVVRYHHVDLFYENIWDKL